MGDALHRAREFLAHLLDSTCQRRQAPLLARGIGQGKCEVLQQRWPRSLRERGTASSGGSGRHIPCKARRLSIITPSNPLEEYAS